MSRDCFILKLSDVVRIRGIEPRPYRWQRHMLTITLYTHGLVGFLRLTPLNPVVSAAGIEPTSEGLQPSVFAVRRYGDGIGGNHQRFTGTSPEIGSQNHHLPENALLHQIPLIGDHTGDRTRTESVTGSHTAIILYDRVQYTISQLVFKCCVFDNWCFQRDSNPHLPR